MKKKTNDTLKNKSILIGLSVLCTGLIAVSFLENDAVSPIRQASGFVITPIQKGINGFGSWLSGLTDNFEDAVSLRKENEELQAKVDTLTEENTQLVQDKEERHGCGNFFHLMSSMTIMKRQVPESSQKNPGTGFSFSQSIKVRRTAFRKTAMSSPEEGLSAS